MASLLLLLSRFSRVRLCEPRDGSPLGSHLPGISRQELWSGLPFLSPMHESEAWKWKMKMKSLSRVQVFETPWTAALPGSSVLEILQAKVLEWVTMPYSSGSSRPGGRTHNSYVSSIGQVGSLLLLASRNACLYPPDSNVKTRLTHRFVTRLWVLGYRLNFCTQNLNTLVLKTFSFLFM